MKAFSEDWMKQRDGQAAVPTQRLSARLERTWTPQWSSSETRAEIRNDPKGTQQGRARAATLAVDTRLKGDRKLLHARPDVSVPLARVSCECRSVVSNAVPDIQIHHCGVQVVVSSYEIFLVEFLRIFC